MVSFSVAVGCGGDRKGGLSPQPHWVDGSPLLPNWAASDPTVPLLKAWVCGKRKGRKSSQTPRVIQQE